MPYGSELKECSEFSNTVLLVFLVRIVILRNSIFWSILNFGTSAGTLFSTVFNEEYDGLIKFAVYSIIT